MSKQPQRGINLEFITAIDSRSVEELKELTSEWDLFWVQFARIASIAKDRDSLLARFNEIGGNDEDVLQMITDLVGLPQRSFDKLIQAINLNIEAGVYDWGSEGEIR